jgi:D-amino peptidase
MKVYISADMEGTSGVVHSDQTDPAHPEYQAARRLMLAEVNAAIEGALAGGATEILVNDSHWDMRNLAIDQLHPAATLLSGTPKPYSMMTGIDASFDRVFFTGYHARAGSVAGILDHTYNGPNIVQGVWINNVEVGEYGVNAALAGYFNVPVALITGDQTACAQAKELLGEDLETVIVKEAVGRVAAKNLHPTRARDLIRAGAERAVKSKRAPYVVAAPITLRLAFARSTQAEQASLIPGVQRTAPRVVELTLDDYAILFRAFRAMLTLGSIQS